MNSFGVRDLGFELGDLGVCQGLVEVNRFGHYIGDFKGKNSNGIVGVFCGSGALLLGRLEKESLLEIGTHLASHLHKPKLSNHGLSTMATNNNKSEGENKNWVLAKDETSHGFLRIQTHLGMGFGPTKSTTKHRKKKREASSRAKDRIREGKKEKASSFSPFFFFVFSFCVWV